MKVSLSEILMFLVTKSANDNAGKCACPYSIGGIYSCSFLLVGTAFFGGISLQVLSYVASHCWDTSMNCPPWLQPSTKPDCFRKSRGLGDVVLRIFAHSIPLGNSFKTCLAHLLRFKRSFQPFWVLLFLIDTSNYQIYLSHYRQIQSTV